MTEEFLVLLIVEIRGLKKDADLIGVPFRVIVSPRIIKQNIVEIVGYISA